MVNVSVGGSLCIKATYVLSQTLAFQAFAGIGDYDPGTGNINIIAISGLSVQQSAGTYTSPCMTVAVPNAVGTHDGFAIFSSDYVLQDGVALPAGTIYDGYIDDGGVVIQ